MRDVQLYDPPRPAQFRLEPRFRPGPDLQAGGNDPFRVPRCGRRPFQAGIDRGRRHDARLSRVNPVTGPVFVEGAAPGDALKITFRKFIPSGSGWTANIPGFGLLADQFPDPALHMWTYDPTSLAPAVYGPKGRVPLKPFAGEIGLAPAEPGVHSVVPPRRVGGNLDIRDLAAGTTLYLPVEVEGALFSIGDTHAAQGDGEVCGTAIESQMDVELTLDLVKGANLQSPRFTTPGPVTRHLDGAGYEATTGIGPDLMTAARESVMRMIDLARGRARPRTDRRLYPALGLRRPAHQRDRRPAELARVLPTSRASSFRERFRPAVPDPRGRGPVHRCPDARRTAPGARKCRLRPGARRNAVPRGRVGLGQVAHGALDHAAPVALARRRSGSITLAGRELTALAGTRHAPAARRRRRDDLPGADDVAQSGHDDRGATDRGHPHPRRRGDGRVDPGAGGRAARQRCLALGQADGRTSRRLRRASPRGARPTLDHPAPKSLPRPAPARCSTPSTSPNRRGAWGNIRTSFRAACGSA